LKPVKHHVTHTADDCGQPRAVHEFAVAAGDFGWEYGQSACATKPKAHPAPVTMADRSEVTINVASPAYGTPESPKGQAARIAPAEATACAFAVEEESHSPEDTEGRSRHRTPFCKWRPGGPVARGGHSI
jgi:hypothetical protein